jgi:hypothetical protein
MKFTSLFNRYSYEPSAAITAIEYEAKKSDGHAKYLLLVVVNPVTFLRNEGN